MCVLVTATISLRCFHIPIWNETSAGEEKEAEQLIQTLLMNLSL